MGNTYYISIEKIYLCDIVDENNSPIFTVPIEYFSDYGTLVIAENKSTLTYIFNGLKVKQISYSSYNYALERLDEFRII